MSEYICILCNGAHVPNEPCVPMTDEQQRAYMRRRFIGHDKHCPKSGDVTDQIRSCDCEGQPQ